MKRALLILLLTVLWAPASAQQSFRLTSPDGRLESQITLGEELTYDIQREGEVLLTPSPLSMTLSDGTCWGKKPQLVKAVRCEVDRWVESPLYRSSQVRECYHALTLRMKGHWSVEFRAYNDGVAYRFLSANKQPLEVAEEQVEYRFAGDPIVTLPYVNRGKEGDFDSQFRHSFENLYTTDSLSRLNPQRLAFLPLVVQASPECMVLLTESHLENYPGLYLIRSLEGQHLQGLFAPYPKEMKVGGYNNIQQLVLSREPFIARVDAPRAFPWRVAIVGEDTTLAASDLTWLLAEPSRIADHSWIKPGKAIWEWWNSWNLAGVDFRAGINTETYRYYIDFAARHGVEYLLVDDGWSLRGEDGHFDLLRVVPELDLQELVRYGAERGVGVILWAGYEPFERDMERVCRHYAAMGVKGFKIDFMDRDDQPMTAFNYRAAEVAARYRLVLDLHGSHKPAGLNRTWPNVLNVEGVYGQENTKWATYDQPLYDVLIPFIRQAAGPMDYTPGAMLNATKRNFHPCNSEPMSMGTRCHQLALYVVLDAPLNMLCDSPTHYEREEIAAQWIARVPTVWDETRVLAGEMGEYIVMARRQGETWWVGGLTNWTSRDLEIDLQSLLKGEVQITLLKDGVNADRKASDFRKELFRHHTQEPLRIHLAPGGGFVATLTRSSIGWR